VSLFLCAAAGVSWNFPELLERSVLRPHDGRQVRSADPDPLHVLRGTEDGDGGANQAPNSKTAHKHTLPERAHRVFVANEIQFIFATLYRAAAFAKIGLRIARR
jgi:hypothetical protein